MIWMSFFICIIQIHICLSTKRKINISDINNDIFNTIINSHLFNIDYADIFNF
jgi:hypothetical protein